MVGIETEKVAKGLDGDGGAGNPIRSLIFTPGRYFNEGDTIHFSVYNVWKLLQNRRYELCCFSHKPHQFEVLAYNASFGISFACLKVDNYINGEEGE